MSTSAWERLVFGCLLLVGCNGSDRDATGTGASLSGITVDPDEGGEGNDGADGNDGNDDEEKLDVGSADTDGPPGGDCPGGGGMMMGDDVVFSYIWIANSPQGTVSKIDTRTGQEIGRYVTGPAEQSEPSRTSVNLLGDVAVSNRGSMGGIGGVFGGTTKIVALEERCDDRNGDGTIQTSHGPAEILAWGEDECVMWNRAVPSTGYQTGARPTAWEGSTEDNGCAAVNPRLWIGWYDAPGGQGMFHRLDGDDGEVLDTVMVPWNGLSYGPYGGAVNQNGDFWVIGWQLGPLVRIDGDTLEVERIEMPAPPAPDTQWSYGMSLDQYGNPWIASGGAAAMYDVDAAQWRFASTGNLSMRGVMVDAEDRAWFAVDAAGMTGGCGLAVVDVTNMQVLASAAALPGCVTPVGVSIDVEGYVWVVDQGANAAFKVDPDTYQLELSVPGLVNPYTYSDMTGAGLNLVVNPPVG
jgi:hypothetical protein